MVDVQVDFDGGSRRDPAAKAGLASAVALMASKGVKGGKEGQGAEPALDENALGEAWADLGAGFEAGADNDALRYSLRSLTDAPLLDRAARLAARQMAEPSWPADIWARDRARWSASLREPPPARLPWRAKPSPPPCTAATPMASAPRPKHWRAFPWTTCSAFTPKRWPPAAPA